MIYVILEIEHSSPIIVHSTEECKDLRRSNWIGRGDFTNDMASQPIVRF